MEGVWKFCQSNHQHWNDRKEVASLGLIIIHP